AFRGGPLSAAFCERLGEAREVVTFHLETRAFDRHPQRSAFHFDRSHQERRPEIPLDVEEAVTIVRDGAEKRGAERVALGVRAAEDQDLLLASPRRFRKPKDRGYTFSYGSKSFLYSSSAKRSVMPAM